MSKKRYGENVALNVILGSSWMLGIVLIAAIFFPPLAFISVIITGTTIEFLDKHFPKHLRYKFINLAFISGLHIAALPAILISFLKRSENLQFVFPTEANTNDVLLFAFKLVEIASISFVTIIGITTGILASQSKEKYEKYSKRPKRFYERRLKQKNHD